MGRGVQAMTLIKDADRNVNIKRAEPQPSDDTSWQAGAHTAGSWSLP